MSSKIKENSLFFAPMESITDGNYRSVIQDLYPEWDYMSCDFLRAPGGPGRFKKGFVIKHFGKEAYKDEEARKKTYFQMMTSPSANTSETIETIQELGFEWLDLNLGCPSKKVNAHFGGSHMLKDLVSLRKTVRLIRNEYKHFFTAKIRVGFHDDKNFENILKLLEDEGVEAITIHGRTRDQLYKGKANWDYIAKAVKICNIPIIGNGDVWTSLDIKDIFETTGCHGVMIARGALKTPWLARWYKEGQFKNDLEERSIYLKEYFSKLHSKLQEQKVEEGRILKQFKNLSRFVFDDYSNCEQLKRSCLRTQSLNDFNFQIQNL